MNEVVKEISNKYSINEELFFYDKNNNKIKTLKVFAITYDEDSKPKTIKYNYLFNEDELFDTFDDAFTYARWYLSGVYNRLTNELKNQSKEGDYHDGK